MTEHEALKQLVDAARQVIVEGADDLYVGKLDSAMRDGMSALKQIEGAMVFEGFANPILLKEDFGERFHDGYGFHLMLLDKKNKHCTKQIRITVEEV